MDKNRIIHNFDAVNKQIKQMQHRERSITLNMYLSNLKKFIIYFFGFMISISILIVAISYSFRLINEPFSEKEIKIVKPEIIEKEVVKIIEVPIQQKQAMIDAQEEIIVKNMTQSYTVFKEKKIPQFKKYGFEEVTTGHKFNKKNSNFPSLQYCYVNKTTIGQNTKLRADLAEIDSNNIYFSNVDSRLARELNTNLSILMEIEEFCQWYQDNLMSE